MKMMKIWKVVKKIGINIKELFFPQPKDIISVRREIAQFFEFLKNLNYDDDIHDALNDYEDEEQVKLLLTFDSKRIYSTTKRPISYYSKPNIYLFMYDRHHSLINRALHLLTFVITETNAQTPDFYIKKRLIETLYSAFLKKKQNEKINLILFTDLTDKNIS